MAQILEVFSGNAFRVAITFVVSGALMGALFTWLTHLPALKELFFIPDENISDVRFSWWLALSVSFTFSLVIGSLVSLPQTDFIRKFRLTAPRALLVLLFVIATLPTLNLILWKEFGLVTPFVYSATFACAMCFVTRSFLLWLFAFFANIIALIGALFTIGFLAVIFKVKDLYAAEITIWAVVFSSLSLCFGLWLRWRAACER